MALTDQALEIIARLSGRDPAQLTPDLDLVADLNFDSGKALELLVELEDKLGIVLDDGDIAAMTSVREILAAVERAAPAVG